MTSKNFDFLHYLFENLMEILLQKPFFEIFSNFSKNSLFFFAFFEKLKVQKIAKYNDDSTSRKIWPMLGFLVCVSIGIVKSIAILELSVSWYRDTQGSDTISMSSND